MRDIAVGEEVTKSYTDISKPKAERCELLATSWGFMCKCDRCEAGDQPDELESVKKKEIADKLMASMSDSRKCILKLDMAVKELPIREKYQGSFSPALTYDMIDAVEDGLNADKPFSEAHKRNLVLLMEKVMAAWLITHGTDHWKYPGLTEMYLYVTRLFGDRRD
jgi:hypothetical protein